MLLLKWMLNEPCIYCRGLHGSELGPKPVLDPVGWTGRWQMIFRTGWAGLSNNIWSFGRTEPGRQRRRRFFVRGGKREMSFPTAGLGLKKKKIKKKKTNNIARQSGQTKQRRSFQTGREKINNEPYLVDNNCKCANEMCLSVFITGL